MTEEVEQFKDLAPNSQLEIEHYQDALDYATTTDSVKNIAMTGPYGAGKSSVIHSYLNKKTELKQKTVCVSLATFKGTQQPETVTHQIERSILQQIFFSVESDDLPLSRFKRLREFKNPDLHAVGILFYSLCLYLFWQHKDALFQHPFVLTIVLCILVLPLVPCLSRLLQILPKQAIKKFSLTAGEIETKEEISEESYLNKHLDELIYFFRTKETKLLVIEDLDRFDNTEIFIKLREINTIINNHPKCDVKFLYAIRDDVFLNKERTKFFEFIIPVIPVINYNTSADKLKDALKNADSDDPLNKESEFLSKIGLYISDLRLIYNILNEYQIYKKTTASEKINYKKLFSIIAYKNVYPCDFEKLHHQEGLFYGLLSEVKQQKDKKIKEKNQQIEKLNLDITELKKEHQQALELTLEQHVKICIGQLALKMNKGQVIKINNGNQMLEIQKLSEKEHLDALINSNKIDIYNYNQWHDGRPIKTTSFQELEKETNLSISYNKRKEKYESDSNTEIEKINNEIRNRQRDIQQVKFSSMQDLFTSEEIEYYAQDLKIKNNLQLFNYLILNGYLNESYHYLISKHIEGSLTTNDRHYVMAMHSQIDVDTGQKLDDPKRVLSEMNDKLLHSDYVLQVPLFDEILQPTKKEQLSMAIDYLKELPLTDVKIKFISTFLQESSHIRNFILELFKESDPVFVKKLFDNESVNNDIAFYLIKFYDELSNISKALTSFCNSNFAQIVMVGKLTRFQYPIFKKLNLTIPHLESIENHSDILDYLYQNDLYEINKDNITYLLREKLNSNIQGNYTQILSQPDSNLAIYIEDNIEDYITDVFLNLPDNQEPEASIINLLTRDDIDFSNKEKIIQRQDKNIVDSGDLDNEIILSLIGHGVVEQINLKINDV